MEQLSLPLKSIYFYRLLKWISALFVVGIVCFGIFYFVYIYSKDRLAELLPNDTVLYFSLRRIESDQVVNLLDKIDVSKDFKEAVNEVLNSFDVTSKNRIFAYALVPSQGQMSKVIILEQSAETSPLVVSLANKYNWHLYKASNNLIQNSSRLILASDLGVLDRIKEVAEKKTPSLTSNITTKLALTETLQFFGTLYITPKGVDQFINPEEQLHLLNEPAVLGIKSIYPEIIGVAGGYDGLKMIDIDQDSEFKASLGNLKDIRNQLKGSKLLDNLKIGMGQDYAEFINDFDFNYFEAEKAGDNWNLSLELEKSTDQDKIKEIFMKVLNYKYLSKEIDVLPDKSEVAVFKVNQAVINPSSGEVDLPGYETSFYYRTNGYRVELGDMPAKQKIEPYFDCSANVRANTITIKSESVDIISKWLKLAKYITYSQYPQSYPQLMLCISY